MGEVGTSLVFENARVKVWAGLTIEVTRAGGRVDTVTLGAGRVYFREARDTHGTRNIGATRYNEVPIELKKPGLAR